MEGTSFPNSSADGLKKHVMKVFEEATKDCEDKVLKEIRDYDSLNKYAIQLFNILANNTLAEEAKELFKPCSDSAVLPDVAVFTIVIRAYAYAGKTKAALKVYQQMIATGYFLEMLDKGMKPHSASYMTVFNAIACRESVEKAREFLEQIQAKGFTPESKVHHFEEGHLTEAMNAMKLYDDLVNKTTDKKMQKVFRKWRTAGGGLAKKESLEMFGALIDDGYVDEANELFKRICETGVYPMVTNHTSVIQAYLKFGKTKGALEAYRGMLASGVAPNSYTYTVLIKGLTIDPNFCGDAKKCILDMMDRGIRPNPATYTAVIEGFAKQEDEAAEEEAKDLVDVMMSEGFVPNAKAMMEVLKGRPTPLIRRVINIVLSKLKG
ncbi:putative pentatricopeptide [Rosa chinensis]|uniref:Putative pentatricopeptide n=1 Tax=Rosa chinensis TaxID=74649 RepID=A0A2P6PH06_ROSCH|nr:putative pentatricopeptide [Rosa chinensis]